MKNMVEIRWHGRGGQGAKTACLLLADAAFASGKYVQGFPEYGPERMGAPITAYNRISDERCTIHSNIYNPDYVVVVDETLLQSVDVTHGLNPEGAIVINTHKSPDEVRPLLRGYEGRVYTLDAVRFPSVPSANTFRTPRCSPPSSRSAACSTRGALFPIWKSRSSISLRPSRRLSQVIWNV